MEEATQNKVEKVHTVLIDLLSEYILSDLLKSKLKLLVTSLVLDPLDVTHWSRKMFKVYKKIKITERKSR